MINEKENTNITEKDQFLEFKDDYKERDKIKLRESYFGERPSQKEIERYLIVKERLNRLLRDKKEQQGLMYVLRLKQKNTNIDQEIEKTGEEYSDLLSKIRGKTGFSNDQVEEFIEGRRIKKIRYYLIQLSRENEEEIKDKSLGKKELFSSLKKKAKEKKSQSLIGVGLIGLPINIPYNGTIGVIVSGLRSDLFDISFDPKDKNASFFLLKKALNERTDTELINFTNREKRIDYSPKELELRNIKIETSNPETEDPKNSSVVEKNLKPFENPSQKQEPEDIVVENFSNRTQSYDKK